MRFAPMMVAFGLALGATAARAEPELPCKGQRPWVAVTGSLPPAMAQAVRSDLRAGLAPGEIEVCELGAPDAPAPLARVALVVVDAARAKFSVDVVDSVTQKRVGRDLSLQTLPQDGRALALAVATEELLRASWAELALRGVRTAETAAPPEVRAMVEKAPSQPPSRPRRSPRAVALGARLAFEHFLGGQTHYGADLVGLWPLGPRLGGIAGLGARRALSVQAAHGSIEASALSGELGLTWSLTRGRVAELGALGSVRALRLRFEAEPEASASARSRSGWAVISRLGLTLALGSGVVRSYSTWGVGVPLKAYAAADNGAVASGASRLELFASTGLAVELR